MTCGFRRKLLAAAAACSVLWLGSPHIAVAEPARYELDPEHTTVAFLVSHLGYAKVLGQFGEARGSFFFDEETGMLSDVEVTVETSSVSTGHAERDRHLRSGDFLGSDRHPQMRFTAAGGRRTGEGTYEIAGQLELRGVMQPLVLHATLNKSGAYPIGDGAYVAGVSARGTLQRGDFGMTYALDNGWVGDDVEIVIELEARRG